MGERGVLRKSWKWRHTHSPLAPEEKLWRVACPEHLNCSIFPVRVTPAIGQGQIARESLHSEKVKLFYQGHQDGFLTVQPACQCKGEVSFLITILATSVHGTGISLAFGVMGVTLSSTHSSTYHLGLGIWLLLPSEASPLPFLPPTSCAVCGSVKGHVAAGVRAFALASPHAWNAHPLLFFNAKFKGISSASGELFLLAQGTYKPPASAALIISLLPTLSDNAFHVLGAE